MFVRAYLRASTDDQNAERARGELERFAEQHGIKIAATYVENESGASLRRPQLFRLLNDCRKGDVLIVEQVDRLSRLNADDWARLKAELSRRDVRVVALDLPTSWSMASATSDEFQSRMFAAINAMMLDVLAAVARKDYDDRKRRQTQGIASARAAGKYKGRQEDTARNTAIIRMLEGGQSWSAIQAATRCSRSTLSRLAKRAKRDGQPR